MQGLVICASWLTRVHVKELKIKSTTQILPLAAVFKQFKEHMASWLCFLKHSRKPKYCSRSIRSWHVPRPSKSKTHEIAKSEKPEFATLAFFGLKSVFWSDCKNCENLGRFHRKLKKIKISHIHFEKTSSLGPFISTLLCMLHFDSCEWVKRRTRKLAFIRQHWRAHTMIINERSHLKLVYFSTPCLEDLICIY